MRKLARLAALGLVAGLLVALSGTGPAGAKPGLKVVHLPSSFSPGPIVTAKNGNMWFIDTSPDAAHVRVGRITPGGSVTIKKVSNEGAYEQSGTDIAASPDGTVWALLNDKAVELEPNGDVKQRVGIQGDGTRAIRVDRNGRPWVVNTDPYGYLLYIGNGSTHTSNNSPECKDIGFPYGLGIGSDNHAWCVNDNNDSSLLRANADGTDGSTYALGGGDRFSASSLAAGPNGKIWFTGYNRWQPNDGGVIGYVRANGTVKKFPTGQKTSPDQLVRRPGTKQMWFVNTTGKPAVGHINNVGHGALHKVGKYKPTALTFDHHGRIWFTDKQHSLVVRVNPKAVSKSNISPGANSVLDPKAKLQTGNFKKYKHPVHVRKHHFFKLRHNCPHKASKCRARVKTTSKKKIHGKHRVIAKPRTVKTSAGKHHSVKLKLTKKGRKLMRHHKRLKVKIKLYLPHHKKASAKRTITLHR